MSHHTLYGLKPLLLYATTFKITRDDLSESALRRNIGDKVDILPPRTVDSWDLLKKAFIQRYRPLLKTAKQLEEIRNFKQEGDETLYQAWELYNDLLYKCPTHDINNHQKDERFEEWCINNPNTPTSRYTKDQENLNPRPKDYPFKDWLLTKVGHTNISEPVKKFLLKIWLIDCFQEDIVKGTRERSFDDYKWMFDLKIDQLANEYELGIGKKGHMLNDIWENCKKGQRDTTYWWHDQKSEEEEMRKLRINIEEYQPPMVYVETFEVKRYSFDTSQSFICVTKELIDSLPMGRENGSRFRDMISKEVDRGRRIHRKT
nr:hypothetical protein [Tanacetum cinerariifolium]